MAVKLLMTWDILPGKEQEYFEFVVRDFIPGEGKGEERTSAWRAMHRATAKRRGGRARRAALAGPSAGAV